MKRTVFSLLLLTAVVAVSAQKYEPNTKWPYLYENFEQGTIYFQDNQKNSSTELNVHLWGNALHYLGSDGKIYQSNDKNVMRVEIGSDAYLFCDHQLMQIVSTEGTAVLVKLTKGEFDSMQSGGGAYGASLNSSASRDLTSLDLGGLDTPELGKMLQEKNDGRIIPTSVHYYFILGGQQVEATKKGVERHVGSDKVADLQKFVKENKIKWKKEDSLTALLKFLTK